VEHPVLTFLSQALKSALLFGLMSASLWAQTLPAEAEVGQAALASAQQWVDQALAQQSPGLPLRTEVVLGRLDPRLKLAACQRIEPYLPPGTRLWGNTRLGLRCAQGSSRWNVFLPLTVKAFGPAWVIKGQVAAGSVMQASDAMEVEVDWAAQASPIVANLDDWVGKSATRVLGTGDALRQDMVRAAQVFQAGAMVRVVASGAGFEIASRGLAVSAGVLGQQARVRMDNGQILQGRVSDHQTVQVML